MKKTGELIRSSTKKNDYMFDSIPGEVIPSKKWTSYIISNYFKIDKTEMIKQKEITKQDINEFEEEYRYVENLIQQDMFYYPEKELELENDLEKYVYNSNSSQLILVLTGKCNMRCEYCVYCEKYPKEIGYSEDDMNLDTALKAVDLYFSLHDEKKLHGYRKQPMINFYGGEPLIKFELIRKIVEYAETKDSSTRFYITTNGLLLDANVADFILRHRFAVTFSLDGFKENHDRNRVTVGGKPTFDIVIRNIQTLQELKKKKGVVQPISFNCCFDNYTDIEKCVDFFNQHYEEFSPFFTMYNQINPYDTSYYTWTEERIKSGELDLNKEAFNKSYKKIRQSIIEGSEIGRKRELSMNLFTSALMVYLRSKWTTTPFNNSCIPLSKIAVYPTGEICLCEKMNKKLIIGNIENGVDYDTLNKYSKMLTYNFVKGKCSTCEAKRICSACFMYMDETGNFNEEFCLRQKQTFKERLSELYQIMEDNPEFIRAIGVNEEFAEVLEVNN